MISLTCEIQKKLYKCSYLQNRNILTDLENELMVTRWEGGGEGWSGRLGLADVSFYMYQ